MYLAEALVRVDRIADAVTNLNPDNITDISMNPPENKQDSGRYIHMKTKGVFSEFENHSPKGLVT